MAAQGLELDPMQRELLLSQLDFFLQAASDAARQDYAALREAVVAGCVAPPAMARLEAILELCLSGERLRKTKGPAAYHALNALFERTPRGQARAAELASLNQALAQLKGAPLVEIGATARGPGAYALALGTENCRIVLRVEAGGIRVESLEVGA
ncbi:MAG TPA: hypothetical protein VKV28_13125 [Candidatus Binataceae bacterium]|nr:hypothetical protein [Candidatus Binataceae bacterium]